MCKKVLEQKLIIYLIILLLFNLLNSVLMELSYDEAYYWVYSKFLAFGYYDHPPMIAPIIAIGTTIFGTNEFGVRAVPILLHLGSFAFCYFTLGRKNLDALFVLFMTLPLIAGSGFLALPDSPLLFFTCFFFWALKKYLREDNLKNSLLVALAIIGLFYSKYHSIVIVALTVASNLSLVKRKSFWSIIAMTVAGYIPHILWQYNHDFVSFKFHLFKRGNNKIELKKVIDYISGQFFVFGMFFVFYIYKIRKKIKTKDKFSRALLFNSAGFLIFLLLVSFRSKIEANWTVSACVAVILLVCSCDLKLKNLLRYCAPIIGVLLVFRVILMLPANSNIMKKIPRLSEVKRWKLINSEIKSISSGYKVVAEKYQYAAKYSFSENRLIPALHFDGRKSQFSILNLQQSINPNEEVFYMGTKKSKDAIIIDVGYKQPIYMKKYKFKDLRNEYGHTR